MCKVISINCKDRKSIGKNSIKVDMGEYGFEMSIQASSVLVPVFVAGCVDGCIEALNDVELSEKELQIIVDNFTDLRDNIDKFIRENTRW